MSSANYGYRCDLCGKPTTLDDDHITTNGGEYMCLACFDAQEAAEDATPEYAEIAA